MKKIKAKDREKILEIVKTVNNLFGSYDSSLPSKKKIIMERIFEKMDETIKEWKKIKKNNK